MDEVDVALSRLLFRNARTSFSDLAKELDLTPQAVHRRFQSLMDSGIIGGTYATLSPRGNGRMWIVVHGWSRAPNMDALAKKLGANHGIVLFQLASGNYVYLHGFVKDVNHLAQFVSFVQREAMLHDAQVGIVPTPEPASDKDFSILDLRIIESLHGDARRPIAEVAEELGTTAKTVKRRIDHLVKDGLVWFTIYWKPDTQGDTVSQLHLEVREDLEKEKVAFTLIKKYSQGVIRTYNFTNLPNHMIITYWSRNVKDMQKTCRDLESEGAFVSVVPNVIRDIYYYPDNVTKVLQEISARKKAGHD